uniref:TLDc domain-containing protein n=1 Tax=Entamoeba invadens TaxID=33085 RepID=S0B002_ENTIV|nr:hypothetical protein [Entamoeba invadens]
MLQSIDQLTLLTSRANSAVRNYTTGRNPIDYNIDYTTQTIEFVDLILQKLGQNVTKSQLCSQTLTDLQCFIRSLDQTITNELSYYSYEKLQYEKILQMNNQRKEQITVYPHPTVLGANHILMENPLLDFQQQNWIERVSGKKIGPIVFDSNSQDWNIGTREMDVVINQGPLCVVITDENHHKFGSVLYKPIRQVGDDIPDYDSFIFIMEQNGDLVKYNIRKNGNKSAFYFETDDIDDLLFSICDETFCIEKKDSNRKGSFSYDQIVETERFNMDKKFWVQRFIFFSLK